MFLVNFLAAEFRNRDFRGGGLTPNEYVKHTHC